jgi:hypothetical protein
MCKNALTLTGIPASDESGADGPCSYRTGAVLIHFGLTVVEVTGREALALRNRYPPFVRYLTRSFALGAMRRGNGIEQFLGAIEVNGVAAIRYVTVSPCEGDCYSIALHTVHDLDDERFADLSEFPSVDPEEYVGEGRELGREADEAEAIELAQRLAGAAPDRWVNFAVASEEYLDLVRSRRSGGNS